MAHVHARNMVPSFTVVAPHRILSPLDGLSADTVGIFGGTGPWLGDISPDMRRRSVCSILLRVCVWKLILRCSCE